jgi:acyl-CoA thioesterase
VDPDPDPDRLHRSTGMSTPETGTPWALDAHLALDGPAVGTASGDLSPDLRGFGGVHGGHVAALALQAMRRTLPNAAHEALSLSVTFARTVQPGGVEVDAGVSHTGRTLTTTTARVLQGGSAKALATASFGVRSPAGLQRRERRMPEVDPPELRAPLGTEPVPGSGGLGIAHRPASGGLPFTGQPQARGSIWMRLADDRPVDELTVAVLADGAVPALFLALTEYRPIPTVELSMHFGTLGPALRSPWLLLALENVVAADGWAVEDGELWTPDGELVAVSRQLRHVPEQ